MLLPELIRQHLHTIHATTNLDFRWKEENILQYHVLSVLSAHCFFLFKNFTPMKRQKRLSKIFRFSENIREQKRCLRISRRIYQHSFHAVVDNSVLVNIILLLKLIIKVTSVRIYQDWNTRSPNNPEDEQLGPEVALGWVTIQGLDVVVVVVVVVDYVETSITKLNFEGFLLTLKKQSSKKGGPPLLLYVAPECIHIWYSIPELKKCT